MKLNRVMLADSYKYSHASQYPKEMTVMFDYMESRGGVYPATIFFGLSYYLKNYFAKPIEAWEVEKAAKKAKMHGVPFDYDGWMYIVNELGGKLPVEIRAVDEGTLVPVKNILMSIKSTDPRVPWVAGWLETILMKVWYPTTIATKSYYVKKMLMKYGPAEWAQFAFHNFGDRGSTSVEAAMIGGAAHLTQFMGTDNFNALDFIEEMYGEEVSGYSVFATEHSSTTSHLKEGEEEFVYRQLVENPTLGIMSFVGDSYDIYNFTDFVTNPEGRIRKLLDSRPEQKFVIRPDSGDPLVVIPKMLEIMAKNGVDYEVDSNDNVLFKGYGILWGDGITPETIEEILSTITGHDYYYSAMNFVFGSGGDLMQNVNRDTQKFAIKCSSISLPEGSKIVTRDVYKDPITDPGKKSKKGEMTLYHNKVTGEYITGPVGVFTGGFTDVLNLVFKDGVIMRDFTFDEVRANSAKS